MKMRNCILLCGMALCLCSANALATPLHLDFTEQRFAVLNNQPLGTVWINELRMNMTFEAQPEGAMIFWDDQRVDGLGVLYSYENDEIEGDERLLISFDEEIEIAGVYLTDFFNEYGYLEQGYYSYLVDDGTWSSWISFTADPLQVRGSTNGELWLDIGTITNSIAFMAPGLVGEENHEFSLGGMEVVHLPEPCSVLLFGSGLIGLFGARRRSKR